MLEILIPLSAPKAWVVKAGDPAHDAHSYGKNTACGSHNGHAT